jgi:ParB family chromosome partitioning protein
LSLADAPFDREDSTLNPDAGACNTCPRRSGYNTTLFCDVQGDQCLDSSCYHSKVEAFLDREIAARPGLVQIENGWRNPKEQRPGAVQRGHVREIDAVSDNPDAEPVMPCEAAKAAIVVYGKQLGRKLTVCTDKHCPVHDPQAAAEAAVNPAPTMAPGPEVETEEEAAERQAEFEQRRAEHEEEQRRREEERKQQFEREQAEHEAEQTRRDELRNSREAMFERISANAPASFNPAQLRILLRAIVNLDPYTFANDLADDLAVENENEQRTAEEVLLSAIDNFTDDKLTGFAIQLALSGHRGIPREGEFDLLTEADRVFTPLTPATEVKLNKTKRPTPIQSASKPAQKAQTKKPKSSKKNIAA